MHVMVCGLRGFPDVLGGVETHSSNLYPIIVELGCSVTVLCRNNFQPKGVEDWKGVKFVSLWCPKSSALEAFVHTMLCVLFAAFKRPDVLHVHAVGPALFIPLARLFGLRTVFTHHGPDYDREKWGAFARFALRLGERLGAVFSNNTISISPVITDLLSDKYNVETTLIPNGVVIPEPVDSSEIPISFGLVPGKYVLLVSRIVPEKRHLDLIEAFQSANLNGWKLALVGEDSHHGLYEEEVLAAAEKNPDIVCTGLQRGESLQSLFAAAGLFVLPSSHEGLPIALLEALSYGLPCLASDIPANKAVGMPANHYFSLGDRTELANSLSDLAHGNWDDDERIRQVQWIRSEFDWHSIAAKTRAVYQAAVR